MCVIVSINVSRRKKSVNTAIGRVIKDGDAIEKKFRKALK